MSYFIENHPEIVSGQDEWMYKKIIFIISM